MKEKWKQKNVPMTAGHSWREEQLLEHSDGREKFNTRITEHGTHEPLFSTQAYKTNVLLWKMFMSWSTTAALHLGPNYLTNSEIHTKFEEIQVCVCHDFGQEVFTLVRRRRIQRAVISTSIVGQSIDTVF